MDILIVDDDNDKIANIVTEIQQISTELDVDTVLDGISAIRKLSEKKYDLILIDLLLPPRQGDEPIETGGHNLVKEIDRKQSILTPKYIVGITQYDKYIDNFSPIWNVLHYNPSVSSWKERLKKIIEHIVKVNTIYYSDQINQNTTSGIFVEGETDKAIINEAIKLFKHKGFNNVEVKTDKFSGGAHWVSNQIIAWAHSLKRDEKCEYMKSVALLDGDTAGLTARDEINRIIPNDSAQRKTFKLINLSPTYAKNLITLYQKGIKIPPAIEELFIPSVWNIADRNGWLEPRQNVEDILSSPKGWDKYKMGLNDYFESLGLLNTEKIYLKKVRKESKTDFCKYVLNIQSDEKKEIFVNFKKLIYDISDYFGE